MNLYKSLHKYPLERIPELLKEYEDDIADYQKHVELKGKTLEVANREHASQMAFYDERRAEVHSVLKYVRGEMAAIRGKLYKRFTEGYPHDLPHTAKEKYIDNEPEYLKCLKVYLEIEELHEKYQSLIKIYEQRGYQLRNITQIRIASLENVDIT